MYFKDNGPHQQGTERGPPFVDLYQSIENAALKRSEKAKPLPSQNFPKLPQKRIKHKSGGNSTLVGQPFVNQGENWENQGYLNVENKRYILP